MKKNLLLACIVLWSTIVLAQNPLVVQNSDKGLYLNHKVAPKENFYSIGRLYHISPKDIAAFNAVDMNKGLAIGQQLRIPLNSSNFSQTNVKGQPVYYVVESKEGLYKVSQKNNGVLMADLRKWNRLPKDNIAAGDKLIVGFLVAADANNMVAQAKEPEIKHPEKQPVEEKKEPVIVKQETVVTNKEEAPKQEPEKRIEPATKQVSSVAMSDGAGGYFKPQFDLQIKTQPVKADQTASAGIFKTSSGWQDAKYYALMDNVEPGTIIKVVNPTNNKAIFAKVLGEMSGIRQNQGYDVRISNAAASALAVSDTDKFIVRVNY